MLPRAGSPKLDLLWKGHSETLLSWAALWARQRSTQLGVVSKLPVGALNSIINIVNKDVKEHWSQDRPQGTPLVTGLHLDREPLITTLYLWPFNQFLIHWVIHP